MVGVFVDGGGEMMPAWLRYGLIFAAVAFAAAAVDLYIISLTPFVVAGLAVIAVRRMEGHRWN